jgi:hypothetical protein
LSIHFLHWIYEKEGLEQGDFQAVLRAAGETETTQENIKDWLQLDEEDPGFQLLTEEEIAVIFVYLFSPSLPIYYWGRRQYATSRKVAGSVSHEVIGFFQFI